MAMRASLLQAGQVRAQRLALRTQRPFQSISVRPVVPTRARMTVVYSSQPETEEQQAAPQEWDTPMPSKRPDIFPEFEKLETTLPKPLPGDPELPDEEAEEDQIRAPPPGDPEPVDPDNPEEPEDPEKDDDSKAPEKPPPGLPRIPQ